MMSIMSMYLIGREYDKMLERELAKQNYLYIHKKPGKR